MKFRESCPISTTLPCLSFVAASLFSRILFSFTDHDLAIKIDGDVQAAKALLERDNLDLGMSE